MTKNRDSDFIQEQLQIEIPVYINIPTESEQKTINQKLFKTKHTDDVLADSYVDCNILEWL